MAMRNLKGEKQNTYPMEAGGKVVHDLPSFSIVETDLPEMKSWEVDEEYEVKVKIKMTSFAKGKEWQSSEENAKEPMRASFDITGIEVETENDDGMAKPHYSAGMKKGETYQAAY